MHGRSDQDTLAHLGGALEHGMIKGQNIRMVEDVILSSSVHDFGFFLAAHLIVEFGAVSTCAVDDNTGCLFPGACLDMPYAVFIRHGFNAFAKTKGHAIHRGMVCHGIAHFIRAGDRTGRDEERADNFRIGLRFKLQDFFAFNNAQFLHAVCNALLIQLFDRSAVIL